MGSCPEEDVKASQPAKTADTNSQQLIDSLFQNNKDTNNEELAQPKVQEFRLDSASITAIKRRAIARLHKRLVPSELTAQKYCSELAQFQASSTDAAPKERTASARAQSSETRSQERPNFEESTKYAAAKATANRPFRVGGLQRHDDTLGVLRRKAKATDVFWQLCDEAVDSGDFKSYSTKQD